MLKIKDNDDKTLKDEYYRIKGHYDARTDIAKDEYYRIVGMVIFLLHC